MKRIFLYLFAFTPLAYLLSRLFILNNVANPIKYIYTITGVSATVILFLSIIISLIKNKINPLKYRKEVGLLGFFYALLHLLTFIVLDAQFDLEFVIKETLDQPIENFD